MENLILPPKVVGEVSAFLQVGCDFIQFNTKCINGATGVYLLWWGQDTTQQVCLSPPVLPPKYSDIGSNDLKHKGIRTSVYHITAEEDQFKNYLCDSDYLFLQIRDFDDNPIGFSAVEKLFRVIDFGGLRDDVPIYDCTDHQKSKVPEVIGHMRIWMTYDVRNKIDCDNLNELMIEHNSEKNANMQLQDSYTSNNDIDGAQTIPVISNKYSKNQTKKQITKVNRSSPVLIISKKKTPLRNLNYSRRARKSEGIIGSSLLAAETTCSKDLPVGMHGDHNDANKVTVKKNVTFYDENQIRSSEYDEVVVNEHNLSQSNTMHNYNRSKEFLTDFNVGADSGDKNITELRKLIDRSNERIAESEHASSKNWKNRERSLIEKAHLYDNATNELENKRNVTSDNMIDDCLSPANLTQNNFYENKENNCPSRINGKSPPQNEENHLNLDQKKNSETSQVDDNYRRPASVPSWNLSTERLKYLGQVNQLIVNVKSVFFKPETYSQIKELWTQNISSKTRESTKYASKGISTLQSNERSTLNSKPKNPPKRTLCSKVHTATPPTFFIAYSIPPERQDTHICSKRGVGAEKRTTESSNELKFNSSVNHLIRFDTQVLDKWWMSTVEFKVYSRSLNQRVPTFIGSASIKLKHLLMNEKYTKDQVQSDERLNHAGLKLTIFASSSLKQALKNLSPNIYTNSTSAQSEILGEISINFAFAKESKKLHISDQSPQHDKNSSQNFKIQPGEKELVPSNTNPMKKINCVRDDDIIVLEVNENENTRASLVTGAEETNLFRERHNMTRIKTSEDPTIQIQSNSSGRMQHLTKENSTSLAMEKSILSDSESLVGLLRVPEGKNYILPHEDTNSVHVACRIFSSGTYIRSKDCEYSSRPGGGAANLSLQHAVSFQPKPKFISDVCKENYLIIESWGTRSNAQEIKSDLIGISSISLHKIYTSFQEHHQINRTRDLELPVMISNGWIAVNNLLDGRYVGHLRVLFAVGFHSQINNLCRILKINFPSQIERLNDFKISDNIRLEILPERINEKEKEANFRSNESKKAIEHRDSYDQIKNQRKDSNECPQNQQVLHKEVNIPIEERENIRTRFESLRLIVLVEEGRNLPIITENRLDKKEMIAKKSSDAIGVRSVLPNTYVSLPRAYNDNFLVDGDPVKAMNAMSSIMPNTSSPIWNMQTVINCPTELLTDSKRQLIIKVWHRPHFDIRSDSQSFSDEAACGIDDYVLGFAAIDVSPLLREGYTSITNQTCDDSENNHIKSTGLCGWYNLIDFVGRRKGQIKVNIQVDMDSNETKKEFARLKSLRIYPKDNLTANSTLHETNTISKKLEANRVLVKNAHKLSSKNVCQKNDSSSQILNEASEIFQRPNYCHNDVVSLNPTTEKAQNKYESRLESSDKRRTSHWKIPKIPDTNLEATHSILHAKMSDLDELAMQLKAKLTTACDKSYSSSPIKVDHLGRQDMNESKENISPPTKQFKDHEKQSLSELRISITKQLSLMQEQLQTKAHSINSKPPESVSKAQKQNEISLANSISKSPNQPLTYILETSDCTSMSRESPTSSITIESGDSQMIEHSRNNSQLDIRKADNLEKTSVVQGAQHHLILTKEHLNINENHTDDVEVINENVAKSNITNEYYQDNIRSNEHTRIHHQRSLPVYSDSILAKHSEEPVDIESTRRVENADVNALQCSLLEIDNNEEKEDQEWNPMEQEIHRLTRT